MLGFYWVACAVSAQNWRAKGPRGGARAPTIWWCARMRRGVRALTAEGFPRWRTLRWPIILIIISSSISIPELRTASSASVLHAAEPPRSACRVSRRSSFAILCVWSRSASITCSPCPVSILPQDAVPTPGCSRCSSRCFHVYHLRTVRARSSGICV